MESVSLFVLMAIFPGEPGLASFIGAKDDGSGGDNWSYETWKLQSNCLHQQTNTQLFHHSTNSVKAVKEKNNINMTNLPKESHKNKVCQNNFGFQFTYFEDSQSEWFYSSTEAFHNEHHCVLKTNVYGTQGHGR